MLQYNNAQNSHVLLDIILKNSLVNDAVLRALRLVSKLAKKYAGIFLKKDIERHVFECNHLAMISSEKLRELKQKPNFIENYKWIEKYDNEITPFINLTSLQIFEETSKIARAKGSKPPIHWLGFETREAILNNLNNLIWNVPTSLSGSHLHKSDCHLTRFPQESYDKLNLLTNQSKKLKTISLHTNFLYREEDLTRLGSLPCTVDLRFNCYHSKKDKQLLDKFKNLTLDDPEDELEGAKSPIKKRV